MVLELQKIGTLTDKQFLACVFMTLLIGNTLVKSLPEMLANYKEKLYLICTLKLALVQQGMDTATANWLLTNIKVVKAETLVLAEYL